MNECKLLIAGLQLTST